MPEFITSRVEQTQIKNMAREAYAAGEISLSRLAEIQRDVDSRDIGADWKNLTHKAFPNSMGALMARDEAVRRKAEFPKA